MIRFLVISALAWLFAGPAISAEIARTGPIQTDPGLGCSLTLSGQIVTGDAGLLDSTLGSETAKLTNYPDFRTETQVVLCLQSPGGSFPEALKLAETIKKFDVTTRINPGESCVSACAIAFLGGQLNTRSGAGWMPSRYLHPTSRLGFHAPDLVIDTGDFTHDDVIKAYRLAIRSVGLVAEAAPDIRLHQILLRKMLGHVGNDVYYISTLDDVAVFRFKLYGYGSPHVGNSTAPTLCWNAYRWSVNRVPGAESAAEFSRALREFRPDESGNWLFSPFDGYMTCKVEFLAARAHGREDAVIMSEWPDFSRPHLDSWFEVWGRLPGPTPLSSVPLGTLRDGHSH